MGLPPPPFTDTTAQCYAPDEHLLLAGDTLEDTITSVAEPASIPTHIAELARLRTWPIHRILPNHGDPGRIAAGGYDASLVDANRAYLRRLLDPAARARGETLRRLWRRRSRRER